MDEKTKYRLNESRQQERLSEFQGDVVTHDLSDSIALTKTLIESAANAGSPVLVKDLLNVLANLTKAHRVEQVRTGELLNKRALRRLAEELCDIIADEFQGVLGFEEKMDRVIVRFAPAITRARNEEQLEEAAV